MASKVLIDQSELSCSICLDVFTDPRVLPCVHTFCYGCLEGWVNKSGSSETINCPLCKHVCPIPSDGLKEIKNNYFIADLIHRINKVELKPSDIEVESIKGSIQQDESVSLIYCKSHDRNVIDQYCIDCDVAACGTCLLRDHRNHNLVDFEEQATISKQQIEGVLQQTDVIIKLIDDEKEDSEKHEKQSADDIDSIKRQINKCIDGIISKQRQQLLKSLDTIQEQKEKVMMTVHDGQAFAKAAVTSLRSYSSNMLRHGRDFDMVQQARDIKSRLASVKEIRVPSFVWSRHDNKHDKAMTSQRDMTVAEVSVTTDGMDSEAVDRLVRGSGAGSVTDKIVSKIPLIDPRIDVAGLAVMNQTVWVVHQAQTSLYAYPVTAPHKPQQFPLIGRLCHPQDMVRFPPGQLQLVIGNNEGQLLWIQAEQGIPNDVWKVTYEKLVTIGYRPLRLGVRGNQLIVCGANYVIHVLSTSGEETHWTWTCHGVYGQVKLWVSSHRLDLSSWTTATDRLYS